MSSLLLAALGGLALGAAFPPLGWWPGALVAVALLWWALRPDHAGWNALAGLVFGCVFFLPHLWWANLATEEAPWIALSVLEASFLALFGAAWTWVRRGITVLLRGGRVPSGAGWWAAVAFAWLFTGVEELRAQVPFGGFPWARLAWSMVDVPLGRAAWLGSSVLVTFGVCLAGLGLAGAVRALSVRPLTRRSAGRAAAAVAIAAAVVVGPAALPLPADPDAGTVTSGDGVPVHDAGQGTAEDGVLVAGAVQGNVDDPGEGVFGFRPELFGNHITGTHELAGDLAGQLDIVLWPEDSSGIDPRTDPGEAAALDAAAEAAGAPILVGSQEYPETGGRYNTALLWEAGQGVTQRYAKQRPAPFGEYIPWRPVVRLLSDQVDRVTTDMLPGGEPAVMEVPAEASGGPGATVPVATVICFEVAYDDIVRDAVGRGAQVLVVPTNNAPFGWTSESTQQLAMTRMQAMTTGRAAVQVSTVGVSGVVAPDGTLVAATELFTHDTFAARLPLRTTLTPAVLAGPWPGWIAAGGAGLLVAAGIAAGVVSRVRGRRRRT
ncbi:apolipoprotein N-acyltransferase [Myceligenerans crystallogenes]|uniref:Apolipoprotein N-acyltransferase n=1 Tax=Myceligenerans crystallogenes TaxID=316335 RepID=A0ABN2N8Y8_9MICO